MLINILLWLFLLFQVKHFVVDFPLQGPYQYKNKGTYGHPGGILHAFLHLAGTFIVLSVATTSDYAISFAALDGVIHYHIDWVKMNINSKMGWGPLTSEKFWWLLGFDQFLHQVTYIAIIALLANGV